MQKALLQKALAIFLILIAVPLASAESEITIIEPNENAVVKETIEITGIVIPKNNTTVVAVSVSIDDGKENQLDNQTTNWKYVFDTTTVQNGKHTIKVVAYLSDKTEIAKEIKVNVQNEKIAKQIDIFGYRFSLPSSSEQYATYINFLLMLGIWLLISLFAIFFLDKVAKWVVGKTETQVDDIILKIIRTPLLIVIFTYGIISSLYVLELSSSYIGYLREIWDIVIIVIGIWVAIKIFRDVLIYYGKEFSKKTDTQLDDILIPVFEKIGIVVIGIFGVIYLLGIFGVNITMFLAGMGVIGLIIAFAAQDTLSNFFSGIYLIIDRPFKIGDVIQLESGELCEVKHIGMRSTRLYNTVEHTIIVLPNNKIANEKIVDLSEPNIMLKVPIAVSVAYGTNVEKVKKILLNIANSNANVLKDKGKEPIVRFSEFGDSSLNFKLWIWVDNLDNKFKVISDINTEINNKFKEEKIEIPFPQRVVWLKKES